MRETALRAVHESLGGRLVPFAGWTMPVQYGSVLAEVELVRSRAGLFDLGHMGRMAISGRDAKAFLQALQTNDVGVIPPGGIRYAMILDGHGRTRDDILVYRDPEDRGFFLVVNAANTADDLAIMAEAAGAHPSVEIVDQTDELGMFAIQGPESLAITQELAELDLSALNYYRWTRGKIAGVDVRVSRTGYTGEDGFEFYVPRDRTVKLWQTLLSTGEQRGLAPAGLGARDILRLEAGMALYGHELDRNTNPLEAGLGWAVKFTHDFTGRAALEELQRRGGPHRKLVGLTTPSPRVPRQGYQLFDGDRALGTVCSGASSPTLRTNIATAYVPVDDAVPGKEVQIEIRGRREPATLVDLPFYKRPR
jgi:aminomethyltransferase